MSRWNSKQLSLAGSVLLVLGLTMSPLAGALDLHIDYEATASPTDGGWYPWYEVAADPSNANNLIVCGSRWDAADNAFYGFVYSTSDAGETWRTSLEDKHSAWVTEHSCDFGVNETAYFVSEASKVIDGKPHHEEGTTRIYVSRDGGQSWSEASSTKWADYSASVVDRNPGPNQNRLYTFYNDDTFVREKSSDASRQDRTRVSAITLSENDSRVSEPIIASMQFVGSYPQRAFSLRDGSIMAVYFANQELGGKKYGVIGGVRTTQDRTSLEDLPVERIPIDHLQDCHPSEFAAAYDSAGNRLFLAYPKLVHGECQLILKSSIDAGRNWSRGTKVPGSGAKHRQLYSPAIAVGRDGVLGLLWRDRAVSNCWYFSASNNGGETFTPPLLLSHCSGVPTSLTEFGASLRTFTGIVPRDPPGHPQLQLQVVDSRNRVWRGAGALTFGGDGRFHAVWADFDHGEGGLHSAVISLERSTTAVFSAELLDLSGKLIAIYGGRQRYDDKDNSLTVDLMLKNDSTLVIEPPLVLRVSKVNSELGRLEITNAGNGLTGRGAAWDLSPALPNGSLKPGECTKPFPLVFRVSCDSPNREIVAVSLEFKALARAADHSQK